MTNNTEYAAISVLDEIYNEVDNTFSVLQLMADAFDSDLSYLPQKSLFAGRAPIYQGTLSIVMNQLHTILEIIGAGKTSVYAAGEQVSPPPKI